MTMNIVQFYDKVNADTALQQKIMAGTNGDVDAVITNAVQLGKAMGYQFTGEEVRAFGDNINELPDDMLELVAAGANCGRSANRGEA